jgi:hypothetical protein
VFGKILKSIVAMKNYSVITQFSGDLRKASDELRFENTPFPQF